MTYREAAAIAFKECGLSQADVDASVQLSDSRSGPEWMARSHSQIPAGYERRAIDKIKKILHASDNEQIVAELERIRGSN